MHKMPNEMPERERNVEYYRANQHITESPGQMPERFSETITRAHHATVTKPLISKLIEIMAAVDHIDKQGTAPAEAGGYAYMYAKDIAHAFRKEFVSRGVLCMGSVIHQERWQDVTKGGKPVQGIDVLMRFTFYDEVTGEQMSVDAIGSGLGGDKAAYKAQTGALKYALRSAFLVPDAAADAEAEEPTAETHEYVKAPQRKLPDERMGRGEVQNVIGDPRYGGSEPSEEEVDAWGGEQMADAPPSRPAASTGHTVASATRQARKVYGPPKNPGERISEKQVGRLFAISRSAGLSDDDVHEILTPFGYHSTKEITKGDYEKICALVESGGLR